MNDPLIEIWNLGNTVPPTIIRSERMKHLLEEIAKQDDLFAYHVPENINSTYDDEKLFVYLQETYSQPYFIIEDPDLIQKNITRADRVLKKGEYKELTATLNSNDEVQVYTLNEKDGTANIRDSIAGIRYKSSTIWTVPLETLVVIGEIQKRTLLSDKAVHYPSKYCWRVSKDRKPDENSIVEYTGPKQEKYEGDYIPDKADGIVESVISDPEYLHLNPVDVVFAKRPKLVQKRKGRFKFDEISLLRVNYVDFKGLAQKYLATEHSHDGITAEQAEKTKDADIPLF